MLTVSQLQPLIDWINEREAIRVRRMMLDAPGCFKPIQAAWEPGAWTQGHYTNDPILGQYRFCNVRRAHDRVTQWIVKNISEPYADHEYLWFMLCIARTINWPDTLQELIDTEGAWPVRPTFNPLWMTHVLEARKERGDKVYTGAYMIRASSSPTESFFHWSKQRYIAEVVLGRLWEDRESWGHDWERAKLVSLERTWEVMQAYVGWGPFMAYQAIVDMRWTRYLRNAPDINTWAALGPGSRRGLNRLLGRPAEHPLHQDEGLDLMLQVRSLINQPGVLASWVGEPLDLSDVQNCLCETDKHLRVKNGEGHPRALYVPGRGS